MMVVAPLQLILLWPFVPQVREEIDVPSSEKVELDQLDFKLYKIFQDSRFKISL